MLAHDIAPFSLQLGQTVKASLFFGLLPVDISCDCHCFRLRLCIDPRIDGPIDRRDEILPHSGKPMPPHQHDRLIWLGTAAAAVAAAVVVVREHFSQCRSEACVPHQHVLLIAIPIVRGYVEDLGWLGPEEPGHMVDGAHGHTRADDVGQDLFGVAVDNALDAGEALEDFAVDEAFRVALFGFWVDRVGARDVVVDQVVRG